MELPPAPPLSNPTHHHHRRHPTPPPPPPPPTTPPPPSYHEIYNEQIFDLLSSRQKKLDIRDRAVSLGKGGKAWKGASAAHAAGGRARASGLWQRMARATPALSRLRTVVVSPPARGCPGRGVCSPAKHDYPSLLHPRRSPLLTPFPPSLPRQGRPEVQNLSRHSITCVGDAMALLSAGAKNRHNASTNLNKDSSRSHCVCALEIGKVNFRRGCSGAGGGGVGAGGGCWGGRWCLGKWVFGGWLGGGGGGREDLDPTDNRTSS